MDILDGDFLREVGIADKSEAEREAFLEHFQEELEVRIGERVTEGMSEEKVGELERVMEGDDDAVVAWLEAERPGYQELVKGVFEGLKAEVLAGKERI